MHLTIRSKDIDITDVIAISSCLDSSHSVCSSWLSTVIMGDGRRLFGKPFGLRRRVYFCFLFCVCPVQLAWLLYVRLPQNVFKVALCHTPSHHVEDLPLSRNVLQGQPLSPFPLSFTSILALPIQSRLLHRLIEEAASWRFCPPSRSLSQGQSWTGALHTVALSPWYKTYTHMAKQWTLKCGFHRPWS